MKMYVVVQQNCLIAKRRLLYVLYFLYNPQPLLTIGQVKRLINHSVYLNAVASLNTPLSCMEIAGIILYQISLKLLSSPEEYTESSKVMGPML